MISSTSYNYIIVGGGSAGCVLANRLTENPDNSVLLVETGRTDSNPLIHMPIGFAKLTSGPNTWGFKTAPQVHANNREIPYAQGRVLGGGSSINAEIFTRGNPVDFDRWSTDEGATGWSFNEIKPYFIRAENNQVYSDNWHGTDGPLGVSFLPDPNVTSRAFVKSCQEYGIPQNPDFNGSSQAGAGIYQTTTLNKKRCSAATAYLKPILNRKNLNILTKCTVQRIVFEGTTATGVELIHNSQLKMINVENEVLVTAGAINSPKLLMLSGVGPADHLREHDIPIIHDLPGVGENLHDHYGIDIIAELKGPFSLDRYNNWYMSLIASMEYALFKTGPFTSNVVEAGAFWYADKNEMVPDLQFHFLAGSGAEKGVEKVPSGSGITLNSYTLRPRSRGTVRLKSNKIDDPPVIDPNFLAEPYDLKTSATGVEISREIFGQPSLQKYIKRMHLPKDEVKSKQDFEAYARQYGRTSYHASCTCKMGADQMAVVDPQLKVRGLEKIRICDSSTMPSLIGSNTNATTIMIGEKASDLIRGNRL